MNEITKEVMEENTQDIPAFLVRKEKKAPEVEQTQDQEAKQVEE